MERESDGRIRVAIVGTGMAGLVTAYLLNLRRDQYDVHVFESGNSPSLDAASVDVDDTEGRTWRIDVPMRAFTDGYYHNLKAMYDFLGVRYRRQRLRYVFSKQTGPNDDYPKQPYFVHTSNHHRITGDDLGALDISTYVMELCFVVLCYAWFTICCLLVTPATSGTTGLSETLGNYLQRIRVPQRFVTLYLLPLFSVVATCSHEELLAFPASDVVNYRRSILFKDHFVVTDGIHKVQSRLTKGLNIKTGTRVVEITRSNIGFQLTISTGFDGNKEACECTFDRVVLAIPPNNTASIWHKVEGPLSSFPIRSVTTIAHNSAVKRAADDVDRLNTDVIHLSTSSGPCGWTEARHDHPVGVSITSNISDTTAIPRNTFSRSVFTRVLRSPRSKQVVDRMFEGRQHDRKGKKLTRSWRNGDDGVWLAGAWCWDGMVLLEGAVTSAMRVAKDFDIQIPW